MVFIMDQHICVKIGKDACVAICIPFTLFRFPPVPSFGIKLRLMPESAVVAELEEGVMGKPMEGEREVRLMSLWRAVTVCLRGVVGGIVEGRGELGGVP